MEHGMLISTKIYKQITMTRQATMAASAELMVKLTILMMKMSQMMTTKN
jgi:hypothetical protein